MNFSLLISSVIGALVGAASYIALSDPVFLNGYQTQDIAQYILWGLAAVTIACILVALYACISEAPKARAAEK